MIGAIVPTKFVRDGEDNEFIMSVSKRRQRRRPIIDPLLGIVKATPLEILFLLLYCRAYLVLMLIHIDTGFLISISIKEPFDLSYKMHAEGME